MKWKENMMMIAPLDIYLIADARWTVFFSLMRSPFCCYRFTETENINEAEGIHRVTWGTVSLSVYNGYYVTKAMVRKISNDYTVRV